MTPASSSEARITPLAVVSRLRSAISSSRYFQPRTSPCSVSLKRPSIEPRGRLSMARCEGPPPRPIEPPREHFLWRHAGAFRRHAPAGVRSRQWLGVCQRRIAVVIRREQAMDSSRQPGSAAPAKQRREQSAGGAQVELLCCRGHRLSFLKPLPHACGDSGNAQRRTLEVRTTAIHSI